jgi:hypothetical protein
MGKSKRKLWQPTIEWISGFWCQHEGGILLKHPKCGESKQVDCILIRETDYKRLLRLAHKALRRERG